MKNRIQQCLWSACVVAMAANALAQSSDLPALPPDMSGNAPMPQVELPSAPAPVPAPMEAAPEQTVAPEQSPQAAPTATTDAMLPVAGDTAMSPPAPAIPQAAPAEVEDSNIKKDFTPSYGEFEDSLMFSSADIERMKKVLYMFERMKKPEKGQAVKVEDDFTNLLENVQPVQTIQEPQSYPSYYLSSIVYRSAKDWMLWINGVKTTSTTLPEDLKILSISPKTVKFLWVPTYTSQAKNRYESGQISKTLPSNLRSSGIQAAYSEEDKGFVFELAPNQTFVTAAFTVYEGKYGEYAVPAMEQQFDMSTMEQEDQTHLAQPIADPDAQLKETMRQMQRLTGNLKQLSPKNTNLNAPPMAQSVELPPAN